MQLWRLGGLGLGQLVQHSGAEDGVGLDALAVSQPVAQVLQAGVDELVHGTVGYIATTLQGIENDTVLQVMPQDGMLGTHGMSRRMACAIDWCMVLTDSPVKNCWT